LVGNDGLYLYYDANSALIPCWRWWGDGGFGVLVKFEAEVVPDYAGGEVAGGDGEGHLVLSRLEQGGVELEGALLPHAFVGVVADGVGVAEGGVVRIAAAADGSGGLAVEGYGKLAPCSGRSTLNLIVQTV
jgi:hypothetical protein